MINMAFVYPKKLFPLSLGPGLSIESRMPNLNFTRSLNGVISHLCTIIISNMK